MKEDATTMHEDRARPGLLPLFALTAFSGLVAAFVFVGFPGIDIAVAALFYNDKGAFIFNYPGIGWTFRGLFLWLSWIAGLAAVAGVILAAFWKRNLLTLNFPKWLYLGLCLALGPALVANLILKDNWGRARPFHVQQFGGKQTFTPVLMHSDQCRKNCSFVSGEASSMYMLFFALAMLSRRRRLRLLLGGVVAGTAAGAVRMAQGGHFLSDVIFSGIIMALVAEGLYWLLFHRLGDTLAEDGPVHRTLLLRAGQVTAAVAGWASRKP